MPSSLERLRAALADRYRIEDHRDDHHRCRCTSRHRPDTLLPPPRQPLNRSGRGGRQAAAGGRHGLQVRQHLLGALPPVGRPFGQAFHHQGLKVTGHLITVLRQQIGFLSDLGG
jgi:hypothetical protein